MKKLGLIFCFLFHLYQCISDIYLDTNNNKFDKMLIFINDNVEEGDGTLITRIKEYMNNASKSLLKATSNMDPKKAGVQFGTVYIRVPTTWAVNGVQIDWQQCNKADFFITADDTSSKNLPYTKQLGKCGEPGQFTRFPKSFFKSDIEKDVFQSGKKIMNEFVKLRYGVFSEEPTRNQLTTFDGQNFINSVCGKDIQWKIHKMDRSKCTEPNKLCNYSISLNQSHNYSVMFDTVTHSSELFCDENERLHNKFAKNMQNRKCRRKSITSVILKHKDFQSEKMSAAFENINFVVVKGQNRRIALVLDTSGSMRGIIENMKTATLEFLSQLEDSAEVGIAEFNTLATIRSGLLNIGTRKEYLRNIIRILVAGGSTNIPDGLAKGVKILGGDIGNDTKLFGMIILLTDGGNNQERPYSFDYAVSQVIKKGILVNTIAYGQQADPRIDKLTKGTGGKYLYSDTSKSYADLLNKFKVKQWCDISISKEIQLLSETSQVIVNGNNFEINVAHIDKYIGNDIKLTYTIPISKSRYSITLLDPKNTTFIPNKRIHQSSGITLIFLIPGLAKSGMYRMRFSLAKLGRYKRQTESFEVSFTISATPPTTSNRIINPTGELSDSEIDILSDDSTIQATVDLTTCGILKEENITVTLVMDAPRQNNMVKLMTDDGMGDDSIEADNIFTKCLIAKDLDEIGFYNFRANVEILNTITQDLIKRTVELGSLRVKAKQSKPIEDKIPPSKIENVKLDIIDSRKKILKVEIQATGNDGMIGNISKYEFMINSSTSIVETKYGNTEPKEILIFKLELQNYNITNPFEVSARGIDDNNNPGEWSSAQIYNWKYIELEKAEIKQKKCSGKLLISFFTMMICLIHLF